MHFTKRELDDIVMGLKWVVTLEEQNQKKFSTLGRTIQSCLAQDRILRLNAIIARFQEQREVDENRTVG